MRKYLGIGITVMVALILVFSYTAKAEFSFKQMVAGMVAELVYNDFKAEIDAEVDEEMSFGKASGYTNMQHVNFVQGLSIGGRDQLSFGNDGILDTNLNLYLAATGTTPLNEGAIYYDDDEKIIKLWDGGQWANVATSSTAEGSLTVSGDRIQLTSNDSFFTFGTTTVAGNGLMTLEATSTAATPLTLRGYTSQTANLFEVYNVGGTELFALDSAGYASSTLLTVSTDFYTTGRATFGDLTGADEFNVIGNSYMTIGTTTESALSLMTVEATSTAAIPLTLRGYTSQTANLFQIHNSSGTELFALDKSGNASTTMISTGALWTSGLVTLNAGQLKSNVNSTTTPASMTLKESDLLGYDTILMTRTGAASNATLTLPASSTMTSMLPTLGDRQDTCLYVSTTTPAAGITLAAGAGIDLETASTSSSDLTITGGNTACFQFFKATQATTTVLMTEFTDGD